MELYLHLQYVFMARCLVKHRDNFLPFTLYYARIFRVVSSLQGFRQKFCMYFSLPHARYMPNHPIFLHSIALIICGEAYKLRSALTQRAHKHSGHLHRKAESWTSQILTIRVLDVINTESYVTMISSVPM
jgi:hypothetical protein